MSLEYKVQKNQWSAEQSPHIKFHNTEVLTPQAEFVRELITRWGMVQAIDDGEDSSGRHKLKLMPPADVVNRAIEVSNIMYKALAESNLLIQLPSMAEMQKTADQLEEDDHAAYLLKKLKAKEKARETE